MIIYNSKMQLGQDKITDFFKLYFLNNKNSQKQSQSAQFTKINLFFRNGLDFRSYKNPSTNFPKPIRQYGFIKKYDKICHSLPHVSAFRPEQIQTIQIMSFIQQVYDCYLNFIKQGLWKNQTQQTYLQELTLLYLHQLYTKGDSKTRRKYITFDRYLLNVFYTINILKSCNKYVKNFANFLNSSYSFGELFLYICLKNVSQKGQEDEMVESQIIKKIVKIFQAEDLSHNVSINISKDSIDTINERKLININSMFIDPIGGALVIPTLKLYKIMKICKIIDEQGISEKQTIQWSQFLKKYFQYIEEETNLSFQHVVSAAVAKNTFQLSKKLLAGQSTQTQQQFLQEAFSYVFQVLQMVFKPEEPLLTDQKTHKNILNLRKHYNYMKNLNEHEISFFNKFCKKILKNSYILQLYKKYN